MKMRYKPVQLIRRLVNQLAVNARTVPAVKPLYESLLAGTGLALCVTQDVLQYLEDKVEQEYDRSSNEQSVHEEIPSS